MIETLTELVDRFWGECTACGAVGRVFDSKLCGICDAVRIHEQQVIHRLTTEQED
jgi:hypothetical protein